MSVREGFVAARVASAVAAAEAPRAERSMLEFEIAAQARAEQFLAQVLHESGGLQFFEEIARGDAYEGRLDLGNTQPGDGRRFKGRGPLQLTGRANYRLFGRQLGLDLEAHPELAAGHDVGWRIAGLFWHIHGLNAFADQHEFVRITGVINGGTNGLESRRAYLGILQRVDCRPVDPRTGFTPNEVRWIHEYDALLAGHRNVDRRLALRQAMTGQRKLIWRAAQATTNGGDGRGWQHASRHARYAALLARTH